MEILLGYRRGGEGRDKEKRGEGIRERGRRGMGRGGGERWVGGKEKDREKDG